MLQVRVWGELLISAAVFLPDELKLACRLFTLSDKLYLQGVKMRLSLNGLWEAEGAFNGKGEDAFRALKRRLIGTIAGNIPRIVSRSNLLNVVGGWVWNRQSNKAVKQPQIYVPVVQAGKITFNLTT
jgi:hypothetical protein